MHIYIVRHGETPYNVGEKRFRGRLNIPLSSLGLAHATQASEALQDIPLDIIYYSKLSRTKQTAQEIKNRQQNARFIEEPHLFDISFGAWEGQKYSDVFTPDEEQKWFSNPHDFIIPEGETFYQVLDRIHRLFKRLRQQEEQHIALVSHGAVINLIFCYLYETHPSHFWQFYVAPCSISEINLKSSGDFTLERINDTHHLSS